MANTKGRATASSNGNAYHELDSAGDLIIKVVEYDMYSDDGNGNHLVIREASFKVSRKTILDNCNSPPFKAMLNGPFIEGSSDKITLHEDTVDSVQLWLRVFENALNDEMYSLPIEEVWNAIGCGRKYLFHMEMLNDWYKTYWGRLKMTSLTLDDLKTLLYPSQTFDNPAAFAFVSKQLVHQGTGHIQEANPSRYWGLHVEGRVIQQLNAARGSMRKKLLDGLFEPLDCVCSEKCPAYEKSTIAYLDAVRNTGVWPISSLTHKSNQAIIDSPGFKNWVCKAPENACEECLETLGGDHVREIRLANEQYWDGLCLDCMDISQTKAGDLDQDYWLHNRLRAWGKGCRLDHSRNSWYFSFMGRLEIIDGFRRDQQKRKRDRESLDTQDVRDLKRTRV